VQVVPQLNSIHEYATIVPNQSNAGDAVYVNTLSTTSAQPATSDDKIISTKEVSIKAVTFEPPKYILSMNAIAMIVKFLNMVKTGIVRY
jgi:lipopolysaccharide export system protein LptC